MAPYAIRDLTAALANVQAWSYLAAKQIQLDYRRNILGVVWIALGFAIMSGGISILMTDLQQRSFSEHVPYVTFGFVGWNFITSMISTGCTVMVQSKLYLMQMRLPRTVFVLSMTIKNFYILIIQLITAAIVSLIFGWRPELTAIWAIAAIPVYGVAGFGAAMCLGHVCAQAPDLTELVQSIMRLMFFLTPIIWIADEGARAQSEGVIAFLMTWNPFAYAINAFRDGLLGQGPDPLNWVVLGAGAAGLLVMGLAALQAFGRRLTYWL